MVCDFVDSEKAEANKKRANKFSYRKRPLWPSGERKRCSRHNLMTGDCNRISVEPGEVFEIEAEAFAKPVNPLAVELAPKAGVIVL